MIGSLLEAEVSLQKGYVTRKKREKSGPGDSDLKILFSGLVRSSSGPWKYLLPEPLPVT